MLTLAPAGSCAVILGETSDADDSTSVSHVTSRGNGESDDLTKPELQRTSNKASLRLQHPNIAMHNLNPLLVLSGFPENIPTQPSSVPSSNFFQLLDIYVDRPKSTKRMRRSIDINNLPFQTNAPSKMNMENSAEISTESNSKNTMFAAAPVEAGIFLNNLPSSSFVSQDFLEDSTENLNEVITANGPDTTDSIIKREDSFGAGLASQTHSTNAPPVATTIGLTINTSRYDTLVLFAPSLIRLSDPPSAPEYNTINQLTSTDGAGGTNLSSRDILNEYESDTSSVNTQNPDELIYEDEGDEQEGIILINTDNDPLQDQSANSPVVDVVEYDDSFTANDNGNLVDKSNYHEALTDDRVDFAFGEKKINNVIEYEDENSFNMEADKIVSENSSTERIISSKSAVNISTKNFTENIHDIMFGDQPLPIPGRRETNSARVEPKKLWNLGWLFEKDVSRSDLISGSPATSSSRSNELPIDSPVNTDTSYQRPYHARPIRRSSLISPNRKGGRKLPFVGDQLTLLTRKGGRKNLSLSEVTNFSSYYSPPNTSNIHNNMTSVRKGGRKTLGNFSLSASELRNAQELLPIKYIGLETQSNVSDPENSHDKVKRELNEAIHVFPHLFNDDLGNHDDYYYDEKDDHFGAFDTFWQESNDDTSDNNSRNKGESNVSHRRFFLPVSHPKETRKATSSAQIPEGMQVMALTRENFHVVAPSEPRLTNISDDNDAVVMSRNKANTFARVRKDAQRSHETHYDSAVEIVPYEAMDRLTVHTMRKKGGASQIAVGGESSIMYQEPISTDIPVPDFETVSSKVQYSHSSEIETIWGKSEPEVIYENNDVLPLPSESNPIYASYSLDIMKKPTKELNDRQPSNAFPVSRGTWSWGPIDRGHSSSSTLRASTPRVNPDVSKVIAASRPEAITLRPNTSLDFSSEYKQVENDEIHKTHGQTINRSKQVQEDKVPININKDEKYAFHNSQENYYQITSEDNANSDKQMNKAASLSTPLEIAQVLIPNGHAHISSQSSNNHRSATPPPSSSSLQSHHGRSRHSKRVTVNVTIATQDDNKAGNGPTGNEKPVYVLSVSVPASDFGDDANINIIQPQTQSEYEGDTINLNSQMMNDIQIPPMMNDASSFVNISLIRSRVSEDHPIESQDNFINNCDCPCDCTQQIIDDRIKLLSEINNTAWKSLCQTYEKTTTSVENVTAEQPVQNETSTAGCVLIVNAATREMTVTSTTPSTTPSTTTTTTTTTIPTTTTTTTTPPPPSFSRDILLNIEGETKYLI